MWDISFSYENEKNFMLKYDFIYKNRRLINEVKEILSKEEIYVCGIRMQLEERGLSLNEIKSKLIQKGIDVSGKELFNILQFLLITEQSIIRREYWNKESTYILMDDRIKDSSFTRSHFTFEDEITGKKRFILLSDTHIGNKEIENFQIINSLYDYGITNGIRYFFHLGDLFTKNSSNNEKDFFLNEIERFKQNYPNPKQNEIMTYALLGNHDEKINNFLKNEYCQDLRILTTDNNSFYMIPRITWSRVFNNLDFLFSHRFFHSYALYDLKVNDIEDLEKNTMWQDGSYHVHVCGHLHKGIIYTQNHYNKQRDILFLGVPSTSNINLGGVVAYDVTVSTDGTINISLLGILNNKIVKLEEINYNSKVPNHSYKRILK